MKKIIIISVVAILAIVAAIIFSLTRPLSQSMEQMFPSEALIYGRLSHVSGDIKQLTDTVFWKNVSTIDVPMVLEHNKVLTAADTTELRRTQKELDAFIKSPLTEKILGKEVALGLYERNLSDAKGSNKAYEFLFATRLTISVQMAELFVSMARSWSDDITTTTEDYHGEKIVHVHFNKKKLDVSYIRIKDVLFASFPSSSLLYRVLDIYHKKEPALASDADFSKAVSHAYNEGHGVFYINVHRFYNLIKKHLPKSSANQLGEGALGFNSYLISFMPAEVSKMKVIMNFDADKMGPYWKSMLNCKPSTNDSLRFAPYNVIAYQWGQCYDFKNMWIQMKQGLHSSPKTKEGVQSWKHRIEKKLKINIYEDVLPILGSQVGGYLNDVDTQGMFPYPRGVLFVKIQDRAAAETLIKKLTDKPLSAIQEEEYQKVNIHFMSLPLGSNMDPGYAFVGDYLLLASSRQLLKTSIDAFNNSNQSLQSDDIIKQFNGDLNQGMALIKMETLTQKLQQLLNWYNKMVSSQITMAMTYQQEAGSHQKEIADGLATKKEELSLAQNKLKELRQKITTPDLPVLELQNQQANIDNLSAQVEVLKEDYNTYKEQQQQLLQILANYKQQSEFAKTWLFNSDEVFMPFLKGLEGSQAIGMSLHLGDQVSETEIFIK